MIDIKKMKQDPDFFKRASNSKNLNHDSLIDEIIEKHDEYLGLLNQNQKDKEELNKTTKIISTTENINEKQKLILSLKPLSEKIKIEEKAIIELKNIIDEKMSHIPNSPLSLVPVGINEEENVVVSTHLNELKKIHNKPHWDILEENNLIMQEEAAFLSGSRNVIYNDKAAKLVKAIELLMLEINTNNGYIQKDTPVFVNEEALFNTGQLPKMKDDLYRLENGQYLIPTAEVTLTNLAANKIFETSDLPQKFTASTLCFRKEAGAAGKDTRGIIRLHQFRKVELVRIANPNNKINELEQMLKDASSILEKLKLPYQILQLCTGDLSFGSEITYDLEVWMPSINNYREISSVSSMGEFQARRMKARYKDESGNNHLVTTLNGSGLAIDRTFAAILENYYDEKTGKVQVPEALQKYVSFKFL